MDVSRTSRPSTPTSSPSGSPAPATASPPPSPHARSTGQPGSPGANPRRTAGAAGPASRAASPAAASAQPGSASASSMPPSSTPIDAKGAKRDAIQKKYGVDAAFANRMLETQEKFGVGEQVAGKMVETQGQYRDFLDSEGGNGLKKQVDDGFPGLDRTTKKSLCKSARTVGLLPPDSLKPGSVRLADVRPKVAQHIGEFQDLAAKCRPRPLDILGGSVRGAIHDSLIGPRVGAAELTTRLEKLEASTEKLAIELKAVSPNGLGAGGDKDEVQEQMTQLHGAAAALRQAVDHVYDESSLANLELRAGARSVEHDATGASTWAFQQMAGNRANPPGGATPPQG
jgi:hypothetical protein